MARRRRRRSFQGTSTQHRWYAAGDARAMREKLYQARRRIKHGDCRIAMTRLLEAEMIHGMLIAEKRHAGRGRSSLRSNPTTAVRNLFNDRCLVTHR